MADPYLKALMLWLADDTGHDLETVKTDLSPLADGIDTENIGIALRQWIDETQYSVIYGD